MCIGNHPKCFIKTIENLCLATKKGASKKMREDAMHIGAQSLWRTFNFRIFKWDGEAPTINSKDRINSSHTARKNFTVF